MSFTERLRVQQSDPARGSALCLLLSECFHTSFGIEKDRPYQWRLLHALLGQHKRELSRQDVFDLMESTAGGKYYSLIDQMLKYLHHLELLTLKKITEVEEPSEGRAKKTSRYEEEVLPRSEDDLKAIKLAGSFEVNVTLEDKLFDSAEAYVPLLVQHLYVSGDGTRKLGRKASLSMMRLIYDFQIGPIYGDWEFFILRLYQYAQRGGVWQTEFVSTVSNSNEHWLILNFLWWFQVNVTKYHPMSSDHIRNQMVARCGVHAVAIDIDNGLEYLAKSKILSAGKDKKYFINESCLPEFNAFGGMISTTCDKFVEAIQNELSAQTTGPVA
jgi:hypothetical protein